MKHLIILNQGAGNFTGEDSLTNKVKEAFDGLDYSIFVSTGSRSSTAYLRDYLKNSSEEVRVYACGGDGTLNEVINGVVGFDNVEVAIYPIGTGNDYIKSFSKSNDYKTITEEAKNSTRFLNFKKLIEAKSTPVDITEMTGESLEGPVYSINVINFGFDAIVGARGNYYKIHGIPADAKRSEKNDPYQYALNHDAMKHGRFNKTEVWADGEKLNEEKLLLCTVSNGQFVGGKFWAAPKSVNNDGLLDVCLFKTMTFLGLGLIIGPYTKGKHLNHANKKIVYRRAKELKVVAPEPIDMCVDGEMYEGKEFTLRILPGAIKFVLPE